LPELHAECMPGDLTTILILICYTYQEKIGVADQEFSRPGDGRFFATGMSKAGWQKAAAVALRKLDMLNAAAELKDLRSPPGNRLEALSGDRQGQWSIRINDQWRICFIWTEAGPAEVEIVDYH